MDYLERQFGFCSECAQVFFRIPGQIMGDTGQQDTEENPIWFWFCDPADYRGEVEMLSVIDCGCSH